MGEVSPAGHCNSDDGLVRLAAQVVNGMAVESRIGSGVTTPLAICTVEGKQTLFEATGADIVDMESYWIARIASQRRVPFVAIRAVTDTRRDVLPPFDRWLNADGRWQWGAVASYFLLHPRHMAVLARLSGNARQARTNLTTIISRLATAL